MSKSDTIKRVGVPMSAHYKYMFALVFCLLFTNQKAHAQNMWGSGYYQGGMQCPYQTSVARNAVSMSDDEKEARQDLDKLKQELKTKQTDRKRAESKIEFLRKKLSLQIKTNVTNHFNKLYLDKSTFYKVNI